MSKVPHPTLEELVLLCFCLEPTFPQLLKHSLKPSKVVCNAVAVHNDVVQVYQKNLQQVLMEDCLHQSLNVAGSLPNLEGIRLYSNRPMGVVNAILCCSCGCTSTWLYADTRLIAEKYRAPPVSHRSGLPGHIGIRI